MTLTYKNEHSTRPVQRYLCIEQNSGKYEEIFVETNMLLEYGKLYSFQGTKFVLAR